MKNLQFILLVVVFTSIISNTASAQWAYDDFSSYDQIQMEIERQNRMMIEQSQRIMQELQARQNRAYQLAIQEYRQQYNDYQTSDAQVLEILWQQFLRENPNYIQNQQQLHNQRMADIQNFGYQNTLRHNERMRASAQNTEDFLNNVIRNWCHK